MTAIARHLVGPRLDALSMPARRTDRIRQRKDAAESFDDARFAADDRPPLRWVIADFEEATIDRHVVPVHVEHDDVARGDANDGVPRAASQRVRAGGADARPTLHLQL